LTCGFAASPKRKERDCHLKWQKQCYCHANSY
jgi:hypothetical protein